MRVVVREGNTVRSQLTVEQDSVLIGSARECQIYLPDLRVAPEHIQLTRTADGWQVELLDHTRMAWLNGAPIEEHHMLRRGDELSVADFILQVFPSVEAFKSVRATPTPPEVKQASSFQLPTDAIVKAPDEELHLPAARANALSQVCFRASAANSLEEFMVRALTGLASRLSARVAWLGLAPEAEGKFAFEMAVTAEGARADRPELCNLMRHRCTHRQQWLCLPHAPVSGLKSAIAGPLLAGDRVAGMFYIDRRLGQPPFGELELDSCRLATMQLTPFSGGIASKQMHRTTEPTLDNWTMTHQIQDRLRPKALPQWQNLEMAVLHEPGGDHPNDIYDVVQMPANLAAVALASTRGIGPVPALMMTEVRTAFRIAAVHADAPHVLMRELNWLVFDMQDGHSMTCLAVIIDPESGAMRYSSAGKSGASIVDIGGRARGMIAVPNPLIGTHQGTQYQEQAETLEAGETLVLFSEGVDRLIDGSGSVFTRNELIDLVSEARQDSLQNICNTIHKDFRTHGRTGSQPDDLTVLLIRRPIT